LIALKSNKDLEIHHIDLNSRNNNYGNLALLCKKHHTMIERYHAYIVRKKRHIEKLVARLNKIEHVLSDEASSLEQCEYNMRYINERLGLGVRIKEKEYLIVAS
jgi:HNH endonuclease